MKTSGDAPGEGEGRPGHESEVPPRVSSLRLVRLRLALALVVAAAVPLVVALAIPSFVDAGRPDQAQVTQAGATLSSALTAQLERSRSTLLLLAANPAAARLATGSGSLADARKAFQAAASVTGQAVAAVSVLDATGRERFRLESGATVAAGAAPADPATLAAGLGLSPGQIYRSQPFAGQDGAPHVVIAAPILNAAGTAVGILRFDLPLLSLLSGAQDSLSAQGGYAQIVDAATGAVIADSRGSGPSASAGIAASLSRPDQLLTGLARRAGQAWTTLVSDGWSAAYVPPSGAVPAFGDWGVVVAFPAVPGAVPVQLLAALAVLVLLLIGLAAWMTRQVLRPAIELDRSRDELTRLLESARQDALRDSLTGLGNHRAFHEELDRQLQIAHRYGVSVGLMLLDLDDFKKVNDLSGHAAGDDVLVAVGSFLVSHVRGTDRAFRIGGDEFAVVMPHTDAESGLVVARRLLGMALEPVVAARLSGGPNRRAVSFSAGVAASPGSAANRAELYAQADAALLWCKRHGRTSVAAYDADRHTLDTEIAIAELSQAVAAISANRSLRPVFQPVVELATGVVIGFEGLVRPLAGSGFDNAGALFTAAERCGRTVELDQASLEVIATQASRIAGDRSISINLSPRSLEAPEFSAHALARRIEGLGIAPSRVVIEVTEREAVDDLHALQANLRACQRVGLRIAADDVGSGNAGLRLLSQIHFDIVKVDLSLVQGGTESSLAVLRSLVDLGHRWGAEVVAEGVETPAQLRVLRALGVTAAQGYLLGRPSEDCEIERVDLDALAAEPAPPPRWTRPVAAASG